MDLDLVGLECALQWDDGLDDERVGVLEVEMHHAHHAHAHELCLVESFYLVAIVFVNGGGDELGLFGGTHGGRLNVFEGCEVCAIVMLDIFQYAQYMRNSDLGIGTAQTLLLVNHELGVAINGDNDDVRQDINDADYHQDIRIFHGDLFRDLHHHEDNDQVGTAKSGQSCVLKYLRRGVGHTFGG